MHTHITKGNVKAAIRDDKAHMTYLKEDVDKDQKYGGKYKDENQTADEKHISKLAGDVKHDEGVSRKSSSPLDARPTVKPKENPAEVATKRVDFIGNMKTQLSKLENVDIRSIWKNESSDFTPWLVRQENINRIGDAIGMDLTVIEDEKPVGPFRADILCKDENSDIEFHIISNDMLKELPSGVANTLAALREALEATSEDLGWEMESDDSGWKIEIRTEI
jgi:hypothetical protein